MADVFLIKKAWVTEKSTALSGLGKYVFLVQKTATKSEIKKVVKQLYKVDAEKVNIVNRPAKPRGGFRYKGFEPGLKKAIVTLKKGQSLDLQ